MLVLLLPQSYYQINLFGGSSKTWPNISPKVASMFVGPLRGWFDYDALRSNSIPLVDFYDLLILLFAPSACVLSAHIPQDFIPKRSRLEFRTWLQTSVCRRAALVLRKGPKSDASYKTAICMLQGINEQCATFYCGGEIRSCLFIEYA